MPRASIGGKAYSKDTKNIMAFIRDGSEGPRAPIRTGYRELTVAGVVLGVIQGVILNVAFVYVALKIGFGVTGSTVAAIMGYALLTGVMKRGTSVENNINQTIASGINTSGFGIVFTLPALFMLDAKWRAEGGPGLDADGLRARVDRLLAECMAPLVENRNLLIETYGMKAGADLILTASAAERNFHRAWSAAADGCMPEARLALKRATATAAELAALVESECR